MKTYEYQIENSIEEFGIECGITIKVGERDHENTALVKEAKKYKQQNQKDTVLWFHLSSFQSPHVLLYIFDPPKNCNLSRIKQFCGNLCKEKSKFKNYKGLKCACVSVEKLKTTETPGQVLINGRCDVFAI